MLASYGHRLQRSLLMATLYFCATRVPWENKRLWTGLQIKCRYPNSRFGVVSRAGFKQSGLHSACGVGADYRISHVWWRPFWRRLGTVLTPSNGAGGARTLVTSEAAAPRARESVPAVGTTSEAGDVYEDGNLEARGKLALRRLPENEVVSTEQPASTVGEKRQRLDAGTPRKKRRKKGYTEDQYRHIGEIRMACKHNDRSAGFNSFREARRNDVKLPPDVLSSMMYLASGGEDWAAFAREACTEGGCPDEPRANNENAERLDGAEMSREVLDYIRERAVKPGEVEYTSQARLAAVGGDPERAFAFAQDAVQKGVQAKLRLFHPALLGFACKGNTEGAFTVRSAIERHGLDMMEYELALLLEACSESGSYEDLVSVLESVGKVLTRLKESTIEHIERFFSSDRAKTALLVAGSEGKTCWLTKRVLVEPDGYCSFAGAQLEGIDLNEEEWHALEEGVKSLALKHEGGAGKFQAFLEDLSASPPAHLLVDGANVAFYGQSREGRGFNFTQIEAMMHLLEDHSSGLRPLLFLHKRRVKEATEKQGAGQYIQKLKSRKQIIITPVGSNDDWYWLYAAVKAGPKGMLISNDEMRDHIFQLLGPKYFYKWKDRHMVRYKFVPSQKKWVPRLIPPHPYTTCTQRLKNGSWMFPSEENDDWLCVKPV